MAECKVFKMVCDNDLTHEGIDNENHCRECGATTTQIHLVTLASGNPSSLAMKDWLNNRRPKFFRSYSREEAVKDATEGTPS